MDATTSEKNGKFVPDLIQVQAEHHSLQSHRESQVNRAAVLQSVVTQINRKERMLDALETAGKIKSGACNYLEWNFSMQCNHHLDYC